jgi:hypothetical protein
MFMNDKRNTFLFIGLLFVFAIIFFLAYAGLKSEEALFDIGIPATMENWLIMFLSVASIIKIVLELYTER